MIKGVKFGLAASCLFAAGQAQAQSATNLPVLKGLAPVATLSKTQAGRAALSANLAATGGIQTGDYSPADAAAVSGPAAAGTPGRFHHRRQSGPARRRVRNDTRQRLSGTGALPRSRALHEPVASDLGSDRLHQRHDRPRLECRKILLRQCHHGRENARIGRRFRDPEKQRRRAGSVRPRLRAACRQPWCRCLWRLASVPDRADRAADRRARLLQHAGGQLRL